MNEELEVSRIGDVLGKALARLGLDQPRDAADVMTRWPDVVGQSIASHAEPTSLRNGVLRLRTNSNAWATELGYLSEDIKTRLNRTLGRVAVKEVRVWVSPEPIKARNARPAPVKAPPPGVSRAQVKDPEEAFQRARAAWLKRRFSGPSRDRFEAPRSKESPW